MNRANAKAGVKGFVMTTSLPALLLSSQLVAQVDDPVGSLSDAGLSSIFAVALSTEPVAPLL